MAISFDTAAQIVASRIPRTKSGAHMNPELGRNARLHAHKDYFSVVLYSTEIVRIYKDHYAISMGRWETRTTADAIEAVTGARISMQTVPCRESNVRVNGYPYFPGIRVSPAGAVLPEDRRPDVFSRVTSEGAKEYTALFRWLRKVLEVRGAMGEFGNLPPTPPGRSHRIRLSLLVELHRLWQAGEEYIPPEAARELVEAAGSYRELAPVANAMRHDWHTSKGNCYIEEVPVC